MKSCRWKRRELDKHLFWQGMHPEGKSLCMTLNFLRAISSIEHESWFPQPPTVNLTKPAIFPTFLLRKSICISGMFMYFLILITFVMSNYSLGFLSSPIFWSAQLVTGLHLICSRKVCRSLLPFTDTATVNSETAEEHHIRNIIMRR